MLPKERIFPSCFCLKNGVFPSCFLSQKNGVKTFDPGQATLDHFGSAILKVCGFHHWSGKVMLPLDQQFLGGFSGRLYDGPILFRYLVCIASTSYVFRCFLSRPTLSAPLFLILIIIFYFYCTHKKLLLAKQTISLLSLLTILSCTWAMRKCKAHTISRETPETPSPEKIPSKKVCHLPWKDMPTCCNFGKDHQALYPQYFFSQNCTEW